jgi:serine protease
MVRRRLAGALTIVCIAWSPHAAAARTSIDRLQPPAGSPADVLLRVDAGASITSLRNRLAAEGFALDGHIPHTRLYAVRTGGQRADAIRVLARQAGVDAAMPNAVRHSFETPNDPLFVPAEGYFETIRLTQAWDLTHGSAGGVIAVVDTGVSAVPDLSGQLLPGRNFVANNTDARDDSIIGHGSLVAGVAAATTNNGIGIAGAGWDTRILPVKVLDNRGVGTDFQVTSGIVWAADQGARVINLSLGGPATAAALCDAVSYAISRGVVVVASAGNSGTTIPNYPASCPGAVSVSAADVNGDFAWFSNFGPTIDLAAPGVSITSTRNDGSYGTESGTSFAAPMVSAVAALVLGQHPDWSPTQVATQLEQSAQDRGPAGDDVYYGHGLLDAFAAVGGPKQPAASPDLDSLEPNDAATEATPLTAPLTATISPEGDVDWYSVRIRWPCVVKFRVDGPAYNARRGPNLRTVLQLYDDDGNLLTAQDDGTYGFVRLSGQVPPGRYYLRVSNLLGSRSRDPYVVAMSTWRLHHVARLDGR